MFKGLKTIETEHANAKIEREVCKEEEEIWTCANIH